MNRVLYLRDLPGNFSTPGNSAKIRRTVHTEIPHISATWAVVKCFSCAIGVSGDLYARCGASGCSDGWP